MLEDAIANLLRESTQNK